MFTIVVGYGPLVTVYPKKNNPTLAALYLSKGGVYRAFEQSCMNNITTMFVEHTEKQMSHTSGKSSYKATPNPQSSPPDFKGSNPPNSPCFTADKKASYAALTVYIGFAGASTCFYATPRARILWFYGSARGAEWSNLCHIQHYDFIASYHPAPQNAFSSDLDKPYMDSS